MTARRSPLAYPGAITLDNLGDLFSFHRAAFGGWRMEADGSGDTSGDKPAGQTGDKPADFQPIQSQADLDRIIGARLARERERYADYDDLKTKASEYDKALEAAKTDQEKAVEAAKNEGRTEALTAANTRLVSAEARALAAEAKFRNPALAVRAVDLTGVKVNDDGTVDVAAIRTKLKELSDAEPYLVDDGKPQRPKPDSAQGGGSDRSSGKLTGLTGDALYDRLHPKKTA